MEVAGRPARERIVVAMVSSAGSVRTQSLDPLITILTGPTSYADVQEPVVPEGASAIRGTEPVLQRAEDVPVKREIEQCIDLPCREEAETLER